MKSHRGEPIKEQADYLVDEGRHEPDVNGVFGRHGLTEWSSNGREIKVAHDQFGRMEYAT